MLGAAAAPTPELLGLARIGGEVGVVVPPGQWFGAGPCPAAPRVRLVVGDAEHYAASDEDSLLKVGVGRTGPVVSYVGSDLLAHPHGDR
jgi:hypothetical protein